MLARGKRLLASASGEPLPPPWTSRKHLVHRSDTVTANATVPPPGLPGKTAATARVSTKST
jgi:hypothetical protein